MSKSYRSIAKYQYIIPFQSLVNYLGYFHQVSGNHSVANLVKRALEGISFTNGLEWSHIASGALIRNRISYGNHNWKERADQEFLARLHHLPSLDEFHLDQGVSGPFDFDQPIFAKMTNVLKPLARAKYWPRLLCLDSCYLANPHLR